MVPELLVPEGGVLVLPLEVLLPVCPELPLVAPVWFGSVAEPVVPLLVPIVPELEPFVPEVVPIEPELEPVPLVELVDPEVDPVWPVAEPVVPVLPLVVPIEPELAPEVDPVVPEVEPVWLPLVVPVVPGDVPGGPEVFESWLVPLVVVVGLLIVPGLAVVLPDCVPLVPEDEPPPVWAARLNASKSTGLAIHAFFIKCFS